MATKKKQTPEEAQAVQASTAQPINIKNRYICLIDFSGSINNTKFSGKKGEVILMESWQANLLKTYVIEE